MAKIYFDFTAPNNGNGTLLTPYNTVSGYTFVAGDEHYFRRGGSTNTNFTITAGLPGRRSVYSTWYYPDGSDDLTKPQPIFNITVGLSTLATAPNNVSLFSLDIRAVLAAGSDSAAVFLGNNSGATSCSIDSNLGCVSAWGKSNVVIAFNTLNGVKTGTQNNNVVTISDSRAMDSVSILSNKITFNGGGGTQSHAIRAENNGSADLTNLLIEDNTISPPAGTVTTTNLTAIGIRLQRCPGARIRRNTVTGMLSGVFCVGGGTPISIHASYNTFNGNLNFGLHLTTDTRNCLIEYNTCNGNGTNNVSASAYGRGIEVSSSAGQGRCSGHTIRFNVCNGNRNYGGPLDNGSEGVGIGIDDGASGCVVYGNVCSNNEGNGIQVYGGNSSTTWTNTANHVVANYLENNCTASFASRRSGGTNETLFIAHINITSVYGSISYVANNYMKGGKLGLSITNNCANVTVINNVFANMPNAIQLPTSSLNYLTNFFDTVSQTLKQFVNVSIVNGVAVFTAVAAPSTAVGNLTGDPLTQANGKPLSNSPLIAAGGPVPFKDITDRRFKQPCNIGPFENYPSKLTVFHA